MRGRVIMKQGNVAGEEQEGRMRIWKIWGVRQYTEDAPLIIQERTAFEAVRKATREHPEIRKSDLHVKRVSD